MRPAPIGPENLGLRDEGWRLVLKSLDSHCSGLGLVVTGVPLLARGPHPMYFVILVLELSHSASRDSKYGLDSQLIGSQWIMLHGEAGASGISGQGTTFCIPRVCAPGSRT